MIVRATSLPGPTRVAHCIHGLGLGGAQKVIAALVRGRQDKQLQYFVYSCTGGVHHEEIESAGATVRILPRHLPKLDPLWAVRLGRQMRRDRIDLVHTHLFGDSLHGALAARFADRRPVIMTLHIGPEGLRGLQPQGYRWLLRRAARVVGCSQAVGSAFTNAGLADGVEIKAIPNGIELPPRESPDTHRLRQLRQRLGVDPEAVLFASIGRLEAQKAHCDLIAAFARLPKAIAARAQLVVLGTGPLEAKLRRQATEADLDNRVLFAGFRSDVPELLPAIDVVVFSSLYEGLPVALLEAMANARCIVTTDVPGIVEAARPDREALVSPRANPEALATALARVAEDPDLRARLAAAAQQRFQHRFTAAAMVQSYEALYHELRFLN